MAKQWKPFEAVDDEIETALGTVLTTVQGDTITLRFAGREQPFLTWKLLDGKRLCELVDAPDAAQEAWQGKCDTALAALVALDTPAPQPDSAQEMPDDDDDDPVDMLRWIVDAYHPQWHYQMGKEGYECAFCRTLFSTSKEFADVGSHKLGCQWAQSKAYLEDTQRPATAPDGKGE